MEVRHKGHFEALALDTCHCSMQEMHPITAWQDAHTAGGNDTALRQMEYLKIDFNTLEASSSGEGALGFSEVGERVFYEIAVFVGPFCHHPSQLFQDSCFRPLRPSFALSQVLHLVFFSQPKFFGCSSRTVTLFKIDKKCPPLYV